MATFLLVHGAWTGAFVWSRVRPVLWTAGHAVFTPTLTGLGERSHLASGAIDLDTHVCDVVNVIEYEDLHDVVLVGHSYAGMVISLVADRIPERIGQLVYLDACLPSTGDSMSSLTCDGPVETTVWPPALRRYQGSRREAVMKLGRLSRQPTKTFLQPVTLRRPLEERQFRRTYVLAKGRATPLAQGKAAAIARADTAWEYIEFNAGHEMMATHPRELARLLIELLNEPGEFRQQDGGPHAIQSSNPLTGSRA